MLPASDQSFGERLIRLFHRVVLFLLARPRLLRLGLGLVLVSFLVTGLRVARERPSGAGLELLSYSRSDFDDYYRASKAFANGSDDPYRTKSMAKAARLLDEAGGDPAKLFLALSQLRGVGSYLYPPFLAFLLTPLSHLAYSPAALVFQALSVLALGGFVFLLYKVFNKYLSAVLRASRSRLEAPEPLSLLVLFAACIFLYHYLSGNAANGNIGFFLIFLCGLGLLASFSDSFGLSFLGGGLLGLAVVLKITPIFLALLLVADRRYLALAGLVFGLVFGLCIPAVYYGMDANLRYLSDWYGLIIKSYQKITFVRSWMNNQSLAGLIGRFFLAGQEVKQSAWGLPRDVLPELGGEARVAFFGGVVKALSLFLYLLSALASVLLALRDGLRSVFSLSWKRHGNSERVDRYSSGLWVGALARLLDRELLRLHLLVVLTLLLSSGVSWYHAYSFAFFVAVLYLFRFLLDFEAPLSRVEYGVFGVLFFFGLVFMGLPKFLREMLAMYSVLVWALYALALALGGSLVWGLLKGRFVGEAGFPGGASGL